jgi:hypothetical protein
MERDAHQTEMEAAWARALELEKEDRLEDAEAVLNAAIQYVGQVAQVAYLYELRMMRMLAKGDRAGAALACSASNRWMRIMASGATSGGEGAALSYEADQHERRLAGLMGAGDRDRERR